MKTCTKCHAVLPLDSFARSASASDGKFCWCRACAKAFRISYNASHKKEHQEYQSLYREKNKDRLRAYSTKYNKQYWKTNKDEIKPKAKEYCRAWYSSKRLDPEYLFKSYRNSAISRTVPFELTKEAFLSFWRKPCHYCGSDIESIGIDRVVNDIGYIITNVVSCCKVCNWMKRAMTSLQFITHVKKIYQHGL